MASGYILECVRPLPISSTETPNSAFLLACHAAMQGETVWERREVADTPLIIGGRQNSYACEVTRGENGNVLIKMFPQDEEAIGWIATRRGNELEKVTGDVLIELSAIDRRRDKRFYVIEAEKDRLGIKAVICCSTL